MQPARRRALVGALGFLSITIASSGLVGVMVRARGASTGNWLWPSLVYFGAMGWQPIVAVLLIRRRAARLDLGLRPANGAWLAVAAVGALAIALIASEVNEVVAALGVFTWYRGASTLLAPASEVPLGAFVLLVQLLVATAVLWLQTLIEEVGWRGFLLPRSVELLGRWGGVALHGIAWGLWYAATAWVLAPEESRVRVAVSVLITCSLLGPILGSLRIVSGSIVVTAITNLVFTFTAALPFVLRGDHPGARAALFAPGGWITLAVVLVVVSIVAGRHRREPRSPARAAAGHLH